MDYVSMKMSIYENYANGKLTQENARQLIDVLNNNYGNTPRTGDGGCRE